MNATPKHLSAMDPSGGRETRQAMARTASALGICCTCNSVDTCTSRATWAGPVVHCEEYDDHVEMPRREPPRRDRNEESRSTLSAAPAVTRSGLCMNCRHNETCGFPRPEGGVWHCGEYE
jgi:hypothetical protein